MQGKILFDILWLVAILPLLLLASCSFYHREWPVKAQDPTARYNLEVVQVDDFGSFWDAGHAREVANRIDTWSQAENTFIVVFIHGWHNDAEPDNGNLINFQQSLDEIAKLMDDSASAQTRQQLTGQASYRLVGVYVGWRGKSLPMPLDYATMWWRKDAAERVGNGDVAEFLERLQRTYLRANSTNATGKNRIIKPFTGLVTIGHSFGGQVLMRALARPIEEVLVEHTPHEISDTEAEPALPNPNATKQEKPIDSFGDINILLNPALEASQYARIDSLYRKLSYDEHQTPQLMVLSADDDWARKSFFPIARVLTLPFRPTFRSSYQGALWGQALGVLASQQTHDLNRSTAVDSLTHADYEAVNEKLAANTATAGHPVPAATLAVPDPLGTRIRHFDFTSQLAFGGAELVPRAPMRVANSPVAIVVTHQDIITQHSGIFNPELRAFLVRYVAFLEGKRMLLRAEKLRNEHAPMGTPSTPAAVER
jgi:hypothetical protein